MLRLNCRKGVSIFANHDFKLKIIVCLVKLTVIFQALSCNTNLQVCELQKVASCVLCEANFILFYLVTPEMDYIKLRIHTYHKIQVTVNIDVVSFTTQFVNLSVSALLVISTLIKLIINADCYN